LISSDTSDFFFFLWNKIWLIEIEQIIPNTIEIKTIKKSSIVFIDIRNLKQYLFYSIGYGLSYSSLDPIVFSYL